MFSLEIENEARKTHLITSINIILEIFGNEKRNTNKKYIDWKERNTTFFICQ